MNIADAVLAVALLLTLLVILGVMREVLILRGHVTALSQLITRPPAPSYLGSGLPRTVASRLKPLQRSEEGSPHVVLYLSNGCTGCVSLIAALRQSLELGQIAASDVSCIVGIQPGDDGIYTAAVATGCRTSTDVRGEMYEALEIRGTPSQLAIWSDTTEVFDYHLGGDMQWIRQRLAKSRGATPGSLLETGVRATST
ncbi:MAG: hypothetical protein ACRDFX_01630 [Chloroflexota bacterium]